MQCKNIAKILESILCEKVAELELQLSLLQNRYCKAFFNNEDLYERISFQGKYLIYNILKRLKNRTVDMDILYLDLYREMLCYCT